MAVNWLLVGTGDIAGKRVGRALRDAQGSNLVAACDKDGARLEAFCTSYKVPRRYESLEEALAAADIDAVYVATPIFLHCDMALQALRAGKNVLVEKPMALNTAEAERMIAEARKAGRKLGVSYFRRYFDKYLYMKEMLQRGEFGRIVLVRQTFFSWFNPAPDDPKAWRVDPKKSGGGPISDMGTHMLDLLVGLFGLPVSVFAKVETNVHDYEAEDSSAVIMKLQNGAQAVCTYHWCSKTWSHEFEVIGTEAKVTWHPFDGPGFVKTVGTCIKEMEMPPAENVHLPLVQRYVEWVEGRGNFDSKGEDAIISTRLIDAIYESSRAGKEILL